MPTIYLKFEEELTAKEWETRQPQMVILQVADRDDALAKAPQIDSLFSGRNYTKGILTNNADIKKDCTLEVL